MSAIATLTLGVGIASAATIQVDSATDDGTDCTLREAIASADGNADSGCAGTGAYGDDTITFAPNVVGAGTIPLGSELVVDPTTPGTLEIEGPGEEELAISGQDAHRVLRVTANANSAANAVTISGLTIRDGLLNTLEGNSAFGGGVRNNGRLTLDHVTVAENAIDIDAMFVFPAAGGGIYSEGTTTLTESTVRDNSVTAESAGGIAFTRGGGIEAAVGTLTIRRSTVSGNTAQAVAGAGTAFATGGGVSITDQPGPTAATIEGSTVAGNTGTVTAGTTLLRGGGIFFRADGNGGTSGSITSSTVAGNTGATTAANLSMNVGTVQNTVVAEPLGGGPNCEGGGSSLGHNLDTDGSCGYGTGSGSISGVPANLEALADNGGPTMTRRPALPTVGTPSPLIDAGVAAGQTLEQRGGVRTVDYDIPNGPSLGDGTDVGAVEVQGAVPTASSPTSPNSDTTPEITGTAEPGTTAQLYRDTTCTTAVGTPVSPATFASPGITVSPALATNSSTSFRATAAYGTATSLCSPTGVTYQVPPDTPSLTSTFPASPANGNNPRIRGMAPLTTTVNLYTTPNCTGPVAGTGPDAAFSDPGIQVSVPDNSTTTFYAQASGAGGASQCSAGITYTESTPPPPSNPVTSPGTNPTPPPALLKCKKGQKLKGGRCVKKKKKKKR